MLIPRFTLRWLLGLTAVCAAVSLILGAAVRGEIWAIGAAVGLASVAVVALLHIATFLATWLLSGLERALFKRNPGASPFATKVSAAPIESLRAESPPPLTG
jgi:hypothetical protein